MARGKSCVFCQVFGEGTAVFGAVVYGQVLTGTDVLF